MTSNPQFQYIDPASDRIRFQGINSLECDEFLYAVRQKARDEQKSLDDDWILAYATACFFGDALRWFVTLPRSVQNSWPNLQREMLEQYESDRFIPIAPRAGGSRMRTPPATPKVTQTFRTVSPPPDVPDISIIPLPDQLYTRRAQALWTYAADPNDPNEISFQKGEILRIAPESTKDKWWQAKRFNGETGLAPSNYIKLLTEMDAAKDTKGSSSCVIC